jgi:hypothetical protein
MEEMPQHRKKHIIDYMKSQAPDEEVTHLEKVASERIYDRLHEVWDVHTDEGRWWVIEPLTNLYPQDDFPSMDYVLSFHVGLMARVVSRQTPSVSEEELDRFAGAWRKWQQAADALRQADESEEFQAVGMRCREALLTYVREVSTAALVPAEQEAPKLGDFIHWSELIAEAVAQGRSAGRIRSYLKKIAASSWELVSWLTHAQNATRFDAHLAVDATENVLAAFGMALVRFERGEPARCPVCSSYKMGSDYRPELGEESSYITVCEVCGWEDIQGNASRKQGLQLGDGHGRGNNGR